LDLTSAAVPPRPSEPFPWPCWPGWLLPSLPLPLRVRARVCATATVLARFAAGVLPEAERVLARAERVPVDIGAVPRSEAVADCLLARAFGAPRALDGRLPPPAKSARFPPRDVSTVSDTNRPPARLRFRTRPLVTPFLCDCRSGGIVRRFAEQFALIRRQDHTDTVSAHGWTQSRDNPSLDLAMRTQP